MPTMFVLSKGLLQVFSLEINGNECSKALRALGIHTAEGKRRNKDWAVGESELSHSLNEDLSQSCMGFWSWVALQNYSKTGWMVQGFISILQIVWQPQQRLYLWTRTLIVPEIIPPFRWLTVEEEENHYASSTYTSSRSKAFIPSHHSIHCTITFTKHLKLLRNIIHSLWLREHNYNPWPLYA